MICFCFSALQRAENSSNNTRSYTRLSAFRFQCSSASRKFLKTRPCPLAAVESTFQCSSASRKFLKSSFGFWPESIEFVSVLFSEPKIPQSAAGAGRDDGVDEVSVLFSEPKIPQRVGATGARTRSSGFSALQRAENSSKSNSCRAARSVIGFSALQRAENSSNRAGCACRAPNRRRFSALQRAENSSNPQTRCVVDVERRFSALQRAENSSNWNIRTILNWIVKFQCSSASRKFLKALSCNCVTTMRKVSVLFSEPKIPQNGVEEYQQDSVALGFSALQRAENSSNANGPRKPPTMPEFQCSSASRKFLKGYSYRESVWVCRVSVLFSEPKIPQALAVRATTRRSPCFSALQRAENSSRHRLPHSTRVQSVFPCSSASRKFLKFRRNRR